MYHLPPFTGEVPRSGDGGSDKHRASIGLQHRHAPYLKERPRHTHKSHWPSPSNQAEARGSKNQLVYLLLKFCKMLAIVINRSMYARNIERKV